MPRRPREHSARAWERGGRCRHVAAMEMQMGKKLHDTALTVDELRQRALKGRTLLGEIRALFPEAHGLAKDDRRLSQGKMGADEAAALRGVVDAMDLQPAAFDSLADDDEGHDPNKLETALLRDRFDRHEIYASLAGEIEEATKVFSDTALAMGALVKPVALAGYEIAKPISKRDDAIRGKLAKALDFYGGRSLAAAAARRANAGKDAKGSGG